MSWNECGGMRLFAITAPVVAANTFRNVRRSRPRNPRRTASRSSMYLVSTLLCRAAIARLPLIFRQVNSFIRLVATEQRRILFVLRGSDIAERSRQSRRAPFVAVGGGGIALRPVRARSFELEVVFFLGGLFVFGTGQAGEKRDQVVLFRFAEAERNDPAVEVRVLHAALVVMIDRIPQRDLRAVVEVRLRDQQVAQAHGAERADIMRLLGHQETPKAAHVGADSQLVDLLLASAALAERVERFARERYEVGVMRRHADVVELLFGKQRLCRIPCVTRHAAALAVENRPSSLGRIADRARVAGDKLVERGVECELRALVRGDRALDIGERNVVPEHILKLLLILGNRLDLRGGGVRRFYTYLHLIGYRALNLRLERRRASVPELRHVEQRVEDGRRVALAELRADTHRGRKLIGETLGGSVTVIARDLAIRGQAIVKKQRLAERNLRRRLRIVRWNHPRIEIGRETRLVFGLRIGQKTGSLRPNPSERGRHRRRGEKGEEQRACGLHPGVLRWPDCDAVCAARCQTPNNSRAAFMSTRAARKSGARMRIASASPS